MTAVEKEANTRKAIERLNNGAPFRLQMKRTGGLADVQEVWRVDSSKLDKEARDKIVQPLADSGLLASPYVTDGFARRIFVSDGFHYAIKFEFDGSVRGAYFDDPGSSNPGLESLGHFIKDYDSSKIGN